MVTFLRITQEWTLFSHPRIHCYSGFPEAFALLLTLRDSFVIHAFQKHLHCSFSAIVTGLSETDSDHSSWEILTSLSENSATEKSWHLQKSRFSSENISAKNSYLCKFLTFPRAKILKMKNELLTLFHRPSSSERRAFDTQPSRNFQFPLYPEIFLVQGIPNPPPYFLNLHFAPSIRIHHLLSLWTISIASHLLHSLSTLELLYQWPIASTNILEETLKEYCKPWISVAL